MTSLFSFTDILYSLIQSFTFVARYDDEGYPIEDEDWDDELNDEEEFDDDFLEDDVSFEEDEENEWE